MERKSLVLKREIVIGDIVEAANLKTYVVDLFARGTGMLRHIIPLEQIPTEELVNNWAELCSEKYFNDHPEINDVMMKVDSDQKSPMKIWLASSDDHIL